ncbi:RCC1 domain-containing protein [Reinekea marinisedimentorum]|uniref:Alpha-tubulin suppressor-like RCC1 family protein n=1 Tax=Reinekea marinisedimentorum TaxID=230495 RepID=A0A4R3I4T2_9GAMM|nr:RCC1 domain-containing protein [Reinekea marinisedimentorum]TCS39775.1 alpha-tubulin suppressor-like RCC1 family protein [Reinekea marinisedimentorum]
MKRVIGFLSLSALLVACGDVGTSSGSTEGVGDTGGTNEDSGETEAASPSISSISAGSFYTGKRVVISGEALAEAELIINGEPVAVLSQSNDSLSFLVPDWPAGEYSLVLENTYGSMTSAVSYIDALKVDKLVSGGYSSCAIVSDSGGSVACWGKNSNGQLGGGSYDDIQTPVFVSGLTNVIDIDVGYVHSCAVMGTGEVVCWGDNRFGQLGNGTELNSSTPVTVSSLNDAVSISVGFFHSCALKSDATVVCWGQNDKNQLGDRTLIHRDEPVAVDALSDVVSFHSDEKTNCAVKTDGSVACWGQNYQGQLGRGHNDQYDYILADVSALGDATAVDVGSSQACAIKADESVVCWGDNGDGELGAGLEASKSTVPVPVVNLDSIASVSLGANVSCALSDAKQVFCWGSNAYGQLRNETTEDEMSVPIAISSIENVESISAGAFHICALHQGGAVSCWGDNQYSQIGTDTDGDYVLAP